MTTVPATPIASAPLTVVLLVSPTTPELAKFAQSRLSAVPVVSGMINVSAMLPKTAVLLVSQEFAEPLPPVEPPAAQKLSVVVQRTAAQNVWKEPALITIRICVNATA